MASTSTAVNLPTNCCYEVFLNHRGSDTKLTFTTHLYRRLVLHGIRVFWDKEEMQVGDDLTCQIQDAIKTASVHVAIFSPQYAKSEWCLEELHLMVQSGKPIIPVFYKIEPGELKRTHGDYAKALQEHGKKTTYDSQPRYNSTTIGNWRTALYTVAETSGLELKKFNGDEGELVDAVVDSVRRNLRGTCRLDVAEHPTGLDDKIEDFEKKVQLLVQSDKPRVIGIVGMGGIGKTTLVKELFNRKKSQYSKFCFLEDVRENERIASLKSLQKKLLEDLTALKDEKIESVSEGIELLKNRLKSFEALVILDDVDHKNQLEALLKPIRDVLHSNSLILITSRDRDVLRKSKVEESSIYQLTDLNPQQSQELFCLHAFTQPHPLPGFEDLVDKYLKACNHLPLSLKVFGGLLYGDYEESFWEDHLEKLQQILPDDIQRSLQISYDALQMDEKIIFLDISCFFIGERRDKAINIWEGCGLKGSRVAFQSLRNKNLVELEDVVDKEGVGADMEIRMHDHVRDLGRHLANNPSLPRRIWRAEDFEDLLQQSSVVTEVRGIRMRWTINEDPSFLPGFKIRNLQLLDIDCDYRLIDMKCSQLLEQESFTQCSQLLEQLNGHLESIMNAVQSPNLIWLRTDARAYFCLPSSFPLTKLRVLEVHEWWLLSLWDKGSQAPLQLRELRITVPLHYVPKSIGQLTNLERIMIRWAGSPKLPEEFCELLSLKHWKMASSTMSSLPDSFGNLTNLKHIDLSGCHALKRLPVSFGNLTRLEYLELSYCSALTMSREILGNICTLRYIDLTVCRSIEVLPSQLAHQCSLEILDLNGLANLTELPSEIGRLRNLKKLNLLRCKKLKSLPDSLGRLNKLTEFTISSCTSLCQRSFKMVEGGEDTCPSLKYLKIIGCEALVEVGRLPDALIDLELAYCPNLRKIEWLTPLSKLQRLMLFWCDKLEQLPSLETLVSLQKLRLANCPNLRKIEWLSPLSKLQRLRIYQCDKLEQLPSLETLVSLEVLVLFNCSMLRSIRGLAHLTKLRTLYVSGCRNLEELAGVGQLRASECRMSVYDCPKLQVPNGLRDQYI